MSWPTVVLAGWLFGLAHVAHCAGMCGPFALAARGPTRFLAYGLGKTTTYMLLGALAGALGGGVHALSHPARTALAVAVGLALVVAGWRLGFLRPGGRAAAASTGPWARLAAKVGALVGDLRSRELPGGRFTLGALTGLLPCGAVVLALLQASVLGDGARGVTFMAAFGLGTLPALGAVVLLAEPVRARLPAARLRQLGGACVLLAGLFTVWRAVVPPEVCCP